MISILFLKEAIIWETKNVFSFFFFFLHFLNLDSVLNILEKKMTLLYFWTYGLRKTWLDKCLKTPVWKDPSINNRVNCPRPY